MSSPSLTVILAVVCALSGVRASLLEARSFSALQLGASMKKVPAAKEEASSSRQRSKLTTIRQELTGEAGAGAAKLSVGASTSEQLRLRIQALEEDLRQRSSETADLLKRAKAASASADTCVSCQCADRRTGGSLAESA